MTLNLTTFSITRLSMIGLFATVSTKTFCIESHYVMSLRWVLCFFKWYAECHYAKCYHYWNNIQSDINDELKLRHEAW